MHEAIKNVDPLKKQISKTRCQALNIQALNILAISHVL